VSVPTPPLPPLPPVIRTDPPPPCVQAIASVAKWAGVVGLWGLAGWLFSKGQTDAGSVVLTLALTHSGMAVQGSTIVAMGVRAAISGTTAAHNTEIVKEAVRDIQENPAQGGTSGWMAARGPNPTDQG
jgi:hypothetical protein